MPNKKCLCKHTAKDHYISDVDVSRGKVFCGADNCTAWNRCDIQLQQCEWKPCKDTAKYLEASGDGRLVNVCLAHRRLLNKQKQVNNNY